jgi:hypothetical protein
VDLRPRPSRPGLFRRARRTGEGSSRTRYACHGDQELFFVIVRRLEAEGDCVLFFTFANLLGNVPDGERAEWDPADPDSFFAGFRVHMEAEGYEYVSAHLLSEPEEGKWAGRALELTESIGASRQRLRRDTGSTEA